MVKKISAIFILAISLNLLYAQSLGLDAAFKGENGKAYFFKGSYYYRFDFFNTSVDPGYPRKISSDNWKGLTFSSTDAAFYNEKGKVFFFSGNRFLVFDFNAQKADPGYPQDINAKTWPGLGFDSIDAAAYMGNNKVLFIKGRKFMVYNLRSMAAEKGYPEDLTEKEWENFPFASVDCALYHEEKLYLFSGNEYARSTNKFKVEKDYPRNASASWRGLDKKGEEDTPVNTATAAPHLPSPAPSSPPVSDKGKGFSPQVLKALPELEFIKEEEKFLAGKGAGKPDEFLGSLGIALTYEQGNYWTGNKYSARGYRVDSGSIKNRKGEVILPEAYRISPPDYSKDHQFAASHNLLYWSFPKTSNKRSYTAYCLIKPGQAGDYKGEKTAFKNLYLIHMGEIKTAGGMEKFPAPVLNNLKEDTIFSAIPTEQVLDPYTVLSKEVTGAVYSETELGTIGKFRIDVKAEGTPYDSYSGNQYGPATVYGHNNRFFPFMDKSGDIGIAWKNQEGSGINVTTVTEKYNVETVRMPENLGILGGFTADTEKAEYYYITVEKGEDPDIRLIRTNNQGKLLKQTTLSCSQNKFNVHVFGDDVMSLLYAKGRIGLNMARTMQKSGDGLNHQGAICAVFNSQSLELINNYGQTSGHSFDSRLTSDGEKFILLNLGDNYPRGIVMHKFLDNSIAGKVIYTFKTAHGTGPSPYRKGKDGKPLPAGKWSNDNYTYTELGNVYKGKNGYVVLFGSEKSPDNKLATSTLNESRNLGMVLVSPDFQSKKQEGNVVSPEVVISGGVDSPDFGFYTFDGWWSPQKYRGVVWLTDYRDKTRENATHIKLAPLEAGTFLALWEKWTNNAFISTYGMICDETGRKLTGEINLGDKVRLHRKDDILVRGKQIIWITGQEAALELNVLELK